MSLLGSKCNFGKFIYNLEKNDNNIYKYILNLVEKSIISEIRGKGLISTGKD